MELFVFNFNFERIGLIDNYQSLEITPNYKKHWELDMIVDATTENVDYFLNNSDDIILTKSNDLKHGYIVDVAKYADESKQKIEVYCKSLGYLLNRRLIINQQTFTGAVEDALRYFVNTNAINPTNVNRKIHNLVLGSLNGFTTSTTEAYSNKYLDEALWETCIKFDIAYDILFDITNKQFIFTVWQGVDRSTMQTINEPVIFAKEFDNILNQNYVDDKSDYRNVAFIVDSVDTTTQTALTVNDGITGLNRREMFINSSDLKGDDETMTNAILEEKAKSKLAENERVQTFETDVDYNSQFVYFKDYKVGDNVTIRSDEIGVVIHTRVVTAKEKYTKDGFDLSIEFGSNKPTLMSKLKKVVK